MRIRDDDPISISSLNHSKSLCFTWVICLLCVTHTHTRARTIYIATMILANLEQLTELSRGISCKQNIDYKYTSRY